jgi:hypothetical protein
MVGHLVGHLVGYTKRWWEYVLGRQAPARLAFAAGEPGPVCGEPEGVGCTVVCVCVCVCVCVFVFVCVCEGKGGMCTIFTLNLPPSLCKVAQCKEHKFLG